MRISRLAEAQTSHEYGCELRRLYPWDGVANPLWGCAVATVSPGEATTKHGHDEEETFIIIRGTGVISVEAESETVGAGDVIYLPRNREHTIRNNSASDPLEFITIYWGSPEATARMREMVAGQGGESPKASAGVSAG